MPRRYQNNKPDKNQSLIDAAAQSVGAEWIALDKLGGAGADRLYIHRGRVYVVEVKNPAQRWTLTESEERLQAKCQRQGVDYNVIETPEELLHVLGY